MHLHAAAPAEDYARTREVIFSEPRVDVNTNATTHVAFTFRDADEAVWRESALQMERPGAPIIPFAWVACEIPDAAVEIQVSVTYKAAEVYQLQAPLEWVQPFAHPGQAASLSCPADATIYNSSAVYPDVTMPCWRKDRAGGVQRITISLFPVGYAPVEQQIQVARQAVIRVTWRVPSPMRMQSTAISPLEPETNTYLIVSHELFVTNSLAAASLDALCAARKSAGFLPKVVRTDWIYAHYPGTNAPAQIRAFLQDAFARWGVRYLLLVGTFDLLPVQKLYMPYSSTYTAFIPADGVYYGCMTGSFDGNNNGRYGELTDGEGGGDVDLIAEIMVGRFPVATVAELASMVKKTLRYETASAQELGSIAFLAEIYNSGGLVYSYGFMEDLRYGTTKYGLTTTGFKNAPGAERYRADTTLYDTSNFTFRATNTLALFNRNQTAINHMGHAAQQQVAKLSLAPLGADFKALQGATNTLPFFIYSQGCLCGAFDTTNCAAEQLVTVTNAAVAAVMNAREGWEYTGVVGGFSHDFHRMFWDSALRGNTSRFGEINDASRRGLLYNLTGLSLWRWVYFGLNLFGDPALPFARNISVVPATVAHTPLLNTYNTQDPYCISAVIEPIGIYDPQQVWLLWSTSRSSGIVVTQKMDVVAGNHYQTWIPAQPEKTKVDYRFFVKTHAGVETDDPAAPATYTFHVTPVLYWTIEGSPESYGVPEPDYGQYLFASGWVAQASAPLHFYEDEDFRRENRGYMLMGSRVEHVATQNVSFVMTRSSTLIWLWQDQFAFRYQTQFQKEGRVVVTNTLDTYWLDAESHGLFPAAQERVVETNGAAWSFAMWMRDGLRYPAAPAIHATTGLVVTADTARDIAARYLPENEDSDRNGLADWWEYRWYGTIGQDAGADADKDGYSTLEEFLARTDPFQATSYPCPPTITFTPFSETQTVPGPFLIQAVITDTYRVASAVVRWRCRGGAWQTTPLHETTNAVYVAWMGDETLPGDDFEYQLMAENPSGYVQITPLYYTFLVYPVADVSRFHNLIHLAFPGDVRVASDMNLHNTGNAPLTWDAIQLKYEPFDQQVVLPGWNMHALGQDWMLSTNRAASAPRALYSKLNSSAVTSMAVRAAVVMPAVDVGVNAMLEFDYWIKTEVDTREPDRAYDGLIVEYSLDQGQTFAQLKGPYTHRIYGWQRSPWTNNTPCFAGETKVWKHARFDLASAHPELAGFANRRVQFRFHHGGDDNTDLEGVYLDNVRLSPLAAQPGFYRSFNTATTYTIPAGLNARITWYNLCGAVLSSNESMTVSLVSNDPALPVYEFTWSYKCVTTNRIPVRIAAMAPSTVGGGLSGLVFGWMSEFGMTYSAESTPQLDPAQWTSDQAILGTGDWIELVVPKNGPQRFYRVRGQYQPLNQP